MGLTEVLTAIFVVLKLIGTIDWSWWLVLLPEIIAVALYVIITVACVLSTRQMNRSFERITNLDFLDFERSNDL